jgi:hypothetical protein
MDNNGFQYRDLHDLHTNRNVRPNYTTVESICISHANDAPTNSLNVTTIAPQCNYRG